MGSKVATFIQENQPRPRLNSIVHGNPCPTRAKHKSECIGNLATRQPLITLWIGGTIEACLIPRCMKFNYMEINWYAKCQS